MTPLATRPPTLTPPLRNITEILPLGPASTPPAPVSMGWMCPKCGSVYGPQVHGCGRCNNPLGGPGAL